VIAGFTRRYLTPAKSESLAVVTVASDIVRRGCEHQFLHSTTERSSGKVIGMLAAGVRGESVKGDPVASALSKSAVPASSTAVTVNASKTYGMPLEAKPDGPSIIWKWRCGAWVLPVFPTLPM
jgi:hypothetical protein